MSYHNEIIIHQILFFIPSTTIQMAEKRSDRNVVEVKVMSGDAYCPKHAQQHVEL